MQVKYLGKNLVRLLERQVRKFMSRVNSRVLRHNRIRKKVKGDSLRPRIAFFKSLKYIYAQVIDDEKGITITAASTNEPNFRKTYSSFKNKEAAKTLGEILSQRIKEKKIEEVVMDRGGFKYHGVIKEFADAVRNGGIKF